MGYCQILTNTIQRYCTSPRRKLLWMHSSPVLQMRCSTYLQHGAMVKKDIAGIAYRQEGIKGIEIHVTDWSSSKQRRFCCCSFGAEILAAADNDDPKFKLLESIRYLFKPTSMPAIKSVLHVDSKALYDDITTPYDRKDYCICRFYMRQTNHLIT